MPPSGKLVPDWIMDSEHSEEAVAAALTGPPGLLVLGRTAAQDHCVHRASGGVRGGIWGGICGHQKPENKVFALVDRHRKSCRMMRPTLTMQPLLIPWRCGTRLCLRPPAHNPRRRNCLTVLSRI